MAPIFHLEAPAKVNLGLRVCGLRADGYHLLESLMAPIDLADGVTLRVEPAESAAVSIEVNGDEPAPAGSDNLACRAAHAFLAHAGLAARVEIGLAKRTPPAAGLGGGSSDAAAVLRGLARAYPDALGAEALEEMALGLGADVPFFLGAGPAWIGGVGERREPARDLPSLSLLLVNAGQPLATGEVYRVWDALGVAPSGALPRPPDLARAVRDPEALAALLHNDLLAAALRLCPAVGRVLRALREAGAVASGLSGSGATCFGIFPDARAARRAAEGVALPPPGWLRVASTREWG